MQNSIVSKYLIAFRSLVLSIADANDCEKVDKFCVGLKPHAILAVLKPGAYIVNDAARIALDVDSALLGAGLLSGGFECSGLQHMDIGNVEVVTIISEVNQEVTRFGGNRERRTSRMMHAANMIRLVAGSPRVVQKMW